MKDPLTILNVEDSLSWAGVLNWMPDGWENWMRETKAFERARKIESPADMLRLLLAWPALRLSLPLLSNWAAEKEIADIAFPSLWERFQAAKKFLKQLVSALIAEQTGEAGDGLFIAICDGTTFSLPGSTKRDWILHLLWGGDRPLEVALTKAEGKGTGETLHRWENVPPEAVIMGDRAYGTPPQLADAAMRGRRFIVRFTWNNLPLFADEQRQQPYNPLLAFGDMQPGQIREFEAWVCPKKKSEAAFKARVVVIRKTIEAGERARRESRQDSTRKGHQPRRETLFLADFIALVTNLPAETAPARTVAEAYRWRWQIEREFKRLKGCSGVRRLDNWKDASVEVYLLALMATWFLANKIARRSVFFPWGCPLGGGSDSGNSQCGRAA